MTSDRTATCRGGQLSTECTGAGAFADRDFPAPHYSVWEERKHPWLAITSDGIEHHD